MSFGLGGKHSLRLVTVSFSFTVLLVGVLNRDLFVHEVLAVHVGNGIVRRFEGPERDKAVTFGQVVLVTGNLESVSAKEKFDSISETKNDIPSEQRPAFQIVRMCRTKLSHRP